MRIAVFLTSYQIGGVEKVFFTLLNEWAKLGHNVYAYVLRNEGEFNRDVDARVSIINLNCNNLWKSCFKVSKLLRQHKIEYFMVGIFRSLRPLHRKYVLYSYEDAYSLSLQSNYFAA